MFRRYGAMLQCLIFIIMLCVTAVSANSYVINIDAMRDVVKRNCHADIVLSDAETMVNIANATSADKIYIKLIAHNGTKNSKKNLTIKCTSQCGIEFIKSFDSPKLDTLSLVNAHLLENTKIRVDTVNMKASEAIVTGLPVAKNVVITLEPSENMLAAQKLITGINVIPVSLGVVL